MIAEYQKQYADLRFERANLFKLIQEKYHPTEVLYPGCSIHITPAFYFPHVIFVDKSPEAVKFFANQKSVYELIARRRAYKRKPYFRFIAQDFTQPLQTPEKQFDLVMAIFTGGVTRACKRYLKTGGLLLTNNHQNDALEAAQESDLSLIADIQFRRGRYQLTENNSSSPIKINSQRSLTKNYLRQTSNGVEYIENEIYYLFKRHRTEK